MKKTCLPIAVLLLLASSTPLFAQDPNNEEDCPSEALSGTAVITFPDNYNCATRRRIRDDMRRNTEAINRMIGSTVVFDEGVVLLQQGRNADAANKIREAIEFERVSGSGDEGLYEKYFHNLGVALYRAGQYQSASRAFRVVTEENDFGLRDGDAHQYLGMVAYRQGSFEESIRESQIAISIDPGNVNARYNLALSFMKLKRLEDAIFSLGQVIQLAPDWDSPKQRLAEVRQLLAARNLSEEQARLFNVYQSIVKIKAGSNEGTGWILSNDGSNAFIVTACHIVTESARDCTDKPNNQIQVDFHTDTASTQSPTSMQASIEFVTSSSSGKDLAVLRVENMPAQYKSLSVASGLAQIDTVTIIGHPITGGDWAPIRGEVKQVYDNGRIILDATISSGASGSPLLDDQNRVTGMVSSLTNDDGVASTAPFVIAQSAESVKEQLKTWGLFP